ncbi:proprotein convertase P-domain-containing protein [Sorangium sp. So ce269]
MSVPADLFRCAPFTRVLSPLVIAAAVTAHGCDGRGRSPGPEASGGGAVAGGGGAVAGGGGGGGDVGGGGGGGAPCGAAADCPGVDGECQRRTCEGGRCGLDPAPRGKPVAEQVAGDCKKRVCDGQGAVIDLDDERDAFSDGDPCSADVCVAGAPENRPAPAATVCGGPGAAGGRYCDGNGACVECLAAGDCLSNVCVASRCVAPGCGDGVANGDETDADCGGPACVPCADLAACLADADCRSGICRDGLCAASSCSDGAKNGAETDRDCGGPACPPCATGKACAADDDCLGGRCSGTTCLPSCTDVARNGAETDIDCGGPACAGCAAGMRCAAGRDCLSGVCSAAGECAAPACGDGVVNAGSEACDDGNASNTDACLATCAAAACGDGFVQAGVEACDDGNASNTDACPPSCARAACGDGFVRTGVEACDDGNRSAGDGCSPACLLEGCGDGAVRAGEECDDGDTDSADGCPITCRAARCGDGFVRAGVEGCDDANASGGDGCSATCAVEAGYTCRSSPSVCTYTKERDCGDADDDDLDGETDCDDPDCALGCEDVVGDCPPGQVLWVQSSADVPRTVADRSVASSVLAVPSAGVIRRVSLELDITHPFDGDIDVSLTSPAGSTVEVSSDNGGSGDNYRGTIFDMGCAAPVTSAMAPFRGCYRPEASFAALLSGPANGTWTLRVGDDAGSDSGTLDAWSLALCIAP